MCGIAGILDSGISSELLETKGRRMMKSLLHRGPDEGGLWRSDKFNLVLLHRRLSIQDLSASGAQPMLSANGRYCIVFNGEIYNFRDLSADLVKRGYQFKGHSDTEVLLAAIEEWGLSAAVEKFVGMFAFTLWDRKDNTLHLCRDRLGEKPLYYGWLGNAFYFSSELKAIESVVEKQSLTIDCDALSDYLKNGYISAPYSIYQKIYKLIPGTILSIPLFDEKCLSEFSPEADASAFSPVSYWSVARSADQGLAGLNYDETDVVTHLDEVLHQSIRRQMVADVKIGAFLSGGTDSTVVTAIAQHECSEKIKTYTIGFNEKEYDESVYAERIAQHLGTDHLTMRVSAKDALDVVPDMALIYDEPFADSSQIPTYMVSKLAREHVTVCLSGDGGDELFAGYNRYHWTQSLWEKLSMVPYPLRLTIGKVLGLAGPGIWDSIYQGLSSFKSNGYGNQKLVGLKMQKLAGFMQQKDIFQAYEFLMSYWREPESLIRREVRNPIRNIWPTLSNANNFVEQAMCLDQMMYLPGDNLTKVDRASMAVSLETRLPLLSHDVVDLSWHIPTSMKIKNGVSKWVLKEVLYKYVPKDMIDRPKMGFSVPVAQWLRHDLKMWADDLIDTIDSSGGGVLQKKIIQKAWYEHLSGKQDHSHRLWTVLIFLSWMNNRS